MSTMPAWHDGKLVPRPFILRLMLARVGDGWQVMPGGFVRVADDVDARAVSLQQGGRTADAWVLSDKPVARAHAAADAGPDRDQPRDRRAAEPRRRQSVLARTLCRTHRGDAAAGAGAAQPRHRERRGGARASIAAHLLAARGLGRGAGRHPERHAGAGRVAPRCKARDLRRRAAVSRRRRAAGGVGDPRAVLAGRLARADRSGRADQFAARRRA